jgi:hypothetical protein
VKKVKKVKSEKRLEAPVLEAALRNECWDIKVQG